MLRTEQHWPLNDFYHIISILTRHLYNQLKDIPTGLLTLLQRKEARMSNAWAEPSVSLLCAVMEVAIRRVRAPERPPLVRAVWEGKCDSDCRREPEGDAEVNPFIWHRPSEEVNQTNDGRVEKGNVHPQLPERQHAARTPAARALSSSRGGGGPGGRGSPLASLGVSPGLHFHGRLPQLLCQLPHPVLHPSKGLSSAS